MAKRPVAPAADPDWDQLHRIARKIELLKQNGEWNRTEFERLKPGAITAAGVFTQGLEFFYNEADPAWLKQ